MEMGMGWEWELSAWEWELRRGSGEKYSPELKLAAILRFSSTDTDLIQFWLDNKSVLLNLYTVARQVQCVPTLSAASERVFSTAGRMLEKRRTNLSPAAVNSLLFLHSNME